MKIKNNDDEYNKEYKGEEYNEGEEYNIVYEINDISKKDKGKVELYII